MAVKQVFNTSAELDYPTVLPTLDLDFANSKTLDPRITFTRASGGSYVGADGLIKYAGVNEARFDHDPETGESLGLLIEEARTNFATNSEAFNDSGWSKTGATIDVNKAIAPDGTLTADEIITSTTGGFTGRVTRSQSVSNGNYTISFYAKKGATDWLMITIEIGGQGGRRVWYNLATGEIGTNAAAFGGVWSFSFGMDYAANGFYRCHITVNITTGGGSLGYFAMCPNENGSATSNQGNSIYIWGAQLEAGAFPTSYIPTIGSTRTRAADNASITGKNFSSWYRQDEGTVATSISHFHLAAPPSDYNNRQAILFRKDANNNIQIRHANGIYNTNVYYGIISDGNLSRARIGDNLPWTPYTLYNISFNYNVNKNISYTLNGLNPQTGMVVLGRDLLIPTGDNAPNELLILQGSSGPFNGWIRNLKYYPKALPPSQLQALTS